MSSTVTAEIVGYGIEARGAERVVEDPQSPSGKTRLLKDFKFAKTTDRIPATLGTAFSMCVRVRGLSRSEWRNLRHEISHPPMLTPSGKVLTNSSYVIANFAEVTDDSITTCNGYGFDHPFEIIRGNWTFSLVLAETPIATKVFLID
jgi:hypothetical protein